MQKTIKILSGAQLKYIAFTTMLIGVRWRILWYSISAVIVGVMILGLDYEYHAVLIGYFLYMIVNYLFYPVHLFVLGMIKMYFGF